MASYQIVMITVPDRKIARDMAKALLGRRLAACVNILDGVESHYWWNNELEEANETLLLVKTKASLLREINAYVRASHPYSIPEVIAFNIAGGNETYLNWLGANCLFTEQPVRREHTHCQNPIERDKK